jgi:hypothetical protein
MRVIEQDRAMRGLELEITRRFHSYSDTGFADAAERIDLKNAIADRSGGLNVLEWISDGADSAKYYPSIYRRFGPERSPIEAAGRGTGRPHSAFRVDSSVVRDLYIGKYQGLIKNSNSKNLLLSLRGVAPTTRRTISEFAAAARNNGTGHHIMTNAEWAYLALKCKAQGFQPRGNNNFGADITDATERGDIAFSYDMPPYVIGGVLTGSGPLGWSHDGSPYGVWDLNGNISEFVEGLQLSNGVIRLVAENNAASPDAAINALYKSVLGDGTLADAGTVGELKYAYPDPIDYGITVLASSVSNGFKGIQQVYKLGEVSNNPCPAILKELCIIPHDAGEYGSDGFNYNLTGSFLCIRGGTWEYGNRSGVFFLDLRYGLATSMSTICARPAFYRV